MTSATTRPGTSTVAAFLAVAVLGGLNAIAVKRTVVELAPLWSAGLRFLLAGLLLIAYILLARRGFPRGRSLSGAVLYGLVAFSGSYALLYTALQDVPAGTAMVFLALVPLETFGLAVLQRQEPFHVQGLLGALIALGGVVLVVADQLSQDVPLVPMLLAIGGSLFIAQGGIVPPDRAFVEAPVESVDIAATASLPAQYSAQIVAGLPGSCSEPAYQQVYRVGNRITIKVFNTEPVEETICMPVYRTYPVNVPLGADFNRGETYTVKVNNIETTFTAQ